MVNKKKIRNKGKFQLSRYFQKLNVGDPVAIIGENAINTNFPKKLQGSTGKIKGKRGKAYIVQIKNKNKEKEFLIEPIHLKKIKQNK